MGRPGPNCKPRICKLCGAEYVPTSTHQSCCNREVQVPCAYCGKLFTKVCTTSDNRKCCSEYCLEEYRKIRRAENARKLIKICKCCSKEFRASNVKIIYCEGPHYKNCVICGKQFEFNPKTNPDTQTCSKDCFVKLQLSHRDIAAEHERMRQVLLEKYGVDNPAKIPGSAEKMKKTCLEKYGKEWFTQTDNYRERVKILSLQKYGTEHWLSSEEVKSKRVETVQAKYGSSNVFSSEYGKNKIRDFWRTHYGVDYSSQAHIQNQEVWNQFKTDSAAYMNEHYPNGITIQELRHDLGVSAASIWYYLDEETIQSKILRNFSTMETGVTLVLKDLKPDLEIHHNRRKLIPPYEIDIFLPEYNIGIECNPTFTHNSSDVDPWGEPTHASDYHLLKTQLAEEKGIFLFHLFGYEWNHKPEIIQSMFRNLLGLNERKIYARNTEVREVSQEETSEFLELYHLQGDANASIRLGLYSKDELVFLTAFERILDEDDAVSGYELIRFCSKADTTVVGGASKLFQYFLHLYDPDLVMSFSDRASFRGEIYSLLGFERVKNTPPGYMWVELSTDRYYSQDILEIQSIQEFLQDPDIDLNKAEHEIMIEHGYVQVFDSGNIVWEYRKK